MTASIHIGAHRKFFKVEKVEAWNGVGNGKDISIPQLSKGSGKHHKIFIGVRGTTPAENKFGAFILVSQNTSGHNGVTMTAVCNFSRRNGNHYN